MMILVFTTLTVFITSAVLFLLTAKKYQWKKMENVFKDKLNLCGAYFCESRVSDIIESMHRFVAYTHFFTNPTLNFSKKAIEVIESGRHYLLSLVPGIAKY